jgi:hypothetical protein
MTPAAASLAFVVLGLDLSVLMPGVYLGASLLVMAAVIALVGRWRRRTSASVAVDVSDQLAQFRSLYERGEISQQEYERLRALLGGQLRQALDVPAPSPEPEPPEPAPPVEGGRSEAIRLEGEGPTAPPPDGVRPA